MSIDARGWPWCVKMIIMHNDNEYKVNDKKVKSQW